MVVLAPTQRLSIEGISGFLSFNYFDEDMVESLTAVGQDSLATISNEGESRGELGSSDGAGKAGNSSDGELHFECD